MRTNLVILLIGLALGFALGFSRGKKATDEDWSRRTVTGVAVDCYDKQGNLIPDEWGTKVGALRISCGPGQTAKVHQSR